MNGVCAVGLSHRTARVEVRERFALDAEARRLVTRRVKEIEGIQEAVVVSTCNRTEVYAAGKPGIDQELPAERIRDLLLESRADSGATAEDFRILHGEEAISHAFLVAAGIDSMVLGETQILGQVRDAFLEAVDGGFVGASFQRLFPAIFKLAKRAHSETKISQGQASVGSIAVELASKVFEDLERRSVLLLGAGDTGETIAVSMHDRKVARLLIAGRGIERSSRLATRVSGVALDIDVALERLAEVDIVLTAASPKGDAFLLDRARLEAAIDQRRGRPLIAIDVGVPRNVDPAARDLDDFFLYDLDDLESVAEETHRRRKNEIKKVEAILASGVRAFVEWWSASAGVAPLVRELHQKAEETRLRELERTLAHLPKEHHAAVERLSKSLVDKLMQAPTIELRRGGDELKAEIGLLRRLFGLLGPGKKHESDGEGTDA